MPKLGAWPLRAVIFIAVAVLAGYFIRQEARLSKNLVLQARNFYGPLKCATICPPKTMPSALCCTARSTTVAVAGSGAALCHDVVLRQAIRRRPRHERAAGKGPVRAGVIGLGRGRALELWAQGRLFPHLRNQSAGRAHRANVVHFLSAFAGGQSHSDGRRAPDAGAATGDRRAAEFDILAVDAFSSDAIPVHLLTREAIQLYFRHLKPEGVLALHISNRYLDLKPVCEGGAEAVGRQAWVVEDEGDEASYFSVVHLGAGDFRSLDVHSGKFFKDAYSLSSRRKKDSVRGLTITATCFRF